MADNTTLNAGSGGDVIASDDIAGVKYQRVKIVHGDDGVNNGDVALANPLPATLLHKNPVSRLFVPAGSAGSNKVYFDLFNGSGSGKVLKIKSVKAVKDGSSAVTGTLSVKLFLTFTNTAGSGGTADSRNSSSLSAISINEYDTDNASLPAEIVARMAPSGGATPGRVIAERHIFPEETAATYEPVEFLSPEMLDVQPLVVREGAGIRVVQGSVASVGNIGFDVLFEIE